MSAAVKGFSPKRRRARSSQFIVGRLVEDVEGEPLAVGLPDVMREQIGNSLGIPAGHGAKIAG